MCKETASNTKENNAGDAQTPSQLGRNEGVSGEMTSTPSMKMAEISAQAQGPSVVFVKADLSQTAWASQETQAAEEEVCLRGRGGPDGPILDSGGGRWQGLAEQCQPRASHLSINWLGLLSCLRFFPGRGAAPWPGLGVHGSGMQ